MDYAKLRPKVAELLAVHPHWTDQQLADGMNAGSVARIGGLTTEQFLNTLSPAKVDALVDLAAAKNKKENGQPEATTLLSYVNYGGFIALAEGTHSRACIDKRVSAGTQIWTASDRDALIAAATSTISWAQAEGLEPVGDGHVRSAREMI